MLLVTGLRIDGASPLSTVLHSSTIDPPKALPPSRLTAKTLLSVLTGDTTVSGSIDTWPIVLEPYS